jgi:ectoine hydroxylase-related dioxygenase (phytanoyl-CoA dioxygenase family)
MTKVSPDPAIARHDHNDIAAKLFEQGYCVVENAVPRALVNALRDDIEPIFEQTALSVGPFYGETTKRLHGLLRRSGHMASFVLQPEILAAVRAVLGEACDTIQLNLTQAIEILPGGLPQAAAP